MRQPCLSLTEPSQLRRGLVFEGVGPDEPIGDFPCLVMEYGAAGLERPG